MRFKAVFSIGAAFLALSVGLLAGAATAGTGAKCGGSAVFAAYGDTMPYIQMTATEKSVQPTAAGTITLSGSTTAVFKGSCTSYLLPQVRLFARNSGSTTGTLQVTVQWEDSAQVQHALVVGTLSSGYTTMQPSPAFKWDGSQMVGNVLVKLTPIGAGANWTVGGVYVDPFKSR
jgi:hypothetical protein